ncbi:alpha-14-N-acetylglucosaminyltransferase [Cricetulus griseus]
MLTSGLCSQTMEGEDTLGRPTFVQGDRADFVRVNSSTEKHWLHVSSDASRLAIIWKYGGIYLDTDVISIRPIPEENFLAAQGSQHSSNGVFGFLPHHPFLWACMENFVEHYSSGIWGNQGPLLMTRMLRVWCRLQDFQELGDLKCLNISFLHPQRFYPIPYPQWRRYYQVWDTEPSFNDSYALHLWNFMNKEGRTVVRGSNTLVENLYRKHCPKTYKVLIQVKLSWKMTSQWQDTFEENRCSKNSCSRALGIGSASAVGGRHRRPRALSYWRGEAAGCPHSASSVRVTGSILRLHCRRWGESGPAGGVSEDMAPPPYLQSSAPVTP